MTEEAAIPNSGGGEPNTDNPQADNSKRRGGGARGDDFSRLSRTGDSLYELLDIPKTSTDADIKKKYRKLALKYHPDKNPNNVEAEEMFKKINRANNILSDEKKRQLYDKYGSFGLHLAEQVGDEMVETLMCLQSGWFKAIFGVCCLITGCYFCCCCLCCCFCCCGKCKPKVDEEDGEMPDVGDLQEGDEETEAKDTTVTEQPKSSPGSKSPTESSPLAGNEPPSYDSVFPAQASGDSDQK